MDEELSALTGIHRASLESPIPLKRETRAQLDRVGAEFLVDFLSREIRRNPTNAPALSELAHVYTRLGRLDDGLEADLALVRLVPDDPTVYYNLACSHALLDQIDPALEALEAAIARGYDDSEHMAKDIDLSSLHGEPRFLAIMRSLQDDWI